MREKDGEGGEAGRHFEGFVSIEFVNNFTAPRGGVAIQREEGHTTHMPCVWQSSIKRLLYVNS